MLVTITMMFLLFDTVFFLILGNALLQYISVKEILTNVLPRISWQVFVLFPWFAVLLWLVEHVYWHNRRLYSTCQLLLTGVGVGLMIVGMSASTSWICTCGGLLCLWLWIADVLVHPHRDEGELDNSGCPIPDGPTLAGDAADLWLKKRSQRPISR